MKNQRESLTEANAQAKRKQNGSNPTGKNPSFPFYTGDWMKDPELRSVSAEARGLWIDLICLMWEAPKKGYLLAGSGVPFRTEHISRMTGVPEGRVIELLGEMEEVGLFSKDEETGAIYNRRMARQGAISEARSEAGSKGGSKRPSNPEASPQAKEKQNRPPSSSSSSSSSLSREKGDKARARSPDQESEGLVTNAVLPPPTLEKVLKQCDAIDLPHWVGEDFFNLWEGRAWYDRDVPVRNWKSLLTTKKNYWISDNRPKERPGKKSNDDNRKNSFSRNGKFNAKRAHLYAGAELKGRSALQ